MSTELNILALPSEILSEICDKLPLADRKTLSEVCRRFEEVAFQPGAANKGVLWLSTIITKTDTYGNTTTNMTVMDRAILEQSKRAYRVIGIELPKQLQPELAQQLMQLVSLLLQNTPAIKELHVVDSHALQIIQLAECMPALFDNLERLTVFVEGETSAVVQTAVLRMPRLVHLEWRYVAVSEKYVGLSQPAILLHAPKLQHAKFGRLCNCSGVKFRCLVQMETVSELRYLEIAVREENVNMLATNQLPNLERLCFFMSPYEYVRKTDWNRIARNMPNLKQVELNQEDEFPSVNRLLQPVLEHCSNLQVLRLDDIDITDAITCNNWWQSLEYLHLQDCLASVPTGQRLVLKLNNLRKLCLTLTPKRGGGSLVLEAPKLQELTFSNADQNLDIADTPELTTLFLRVPQCKFLRFLDQPLPKLRRIIIDTPRHISNEELLLYKRAIKAGANVQRLTLYCRSGEAAKHIMDDVIATMRSLKTIAIVGLGNTANIKAETLSNLFRLPQLQVTILCGSCWRLFAN
uniref:F-box domain-containing protein n=1 Tax=Anopheles maculatus TaxID=74869 RepID=A0A182SA40_9DIPT